MKWKFWRPTNAPGPDQRLGPPSPGPIPRVVYLHLVDELELGPDWVRTLFWVARPVSGRSELQAFRVFSPTQATSCGIAVRDYAALNDHRQLILFSGTVDAAKGKVSLTPGNKRSAA